MLEPAVYMAVNRIAMAFPTPPGTSLDHPWNILVIAAIVFEEPSGDRALVHFFSEGGSADPLLPATSGEHGLKTTRREHRRESQSRYFEEYAFQDSAFFPRILVSSERCVLSRLAI